MAIYLEERGNSKAPTIVFIHGGVALSSWMWQKQVDYFKDYHCIIPDLPEHGNSYRNGKISISNCVNEIAEIIEKKANNGKASVIGYSYGSKVIIDLLTSRCELVSHAIIASALSRPVPIMKFSNSPGAMKLASYILRSRPIRQLLIKYLNFPCNSYRFNCSREISRLTSGKLYRIFHEFCHNLNLPQELEKVKVPTLVIAGEKESQPMKQSIIDIVNLIPNAKGVLVRNGSHTYPWSMHEVFNIIVECWINDKEIPDIFTSDVL
ncbi:UNVERIFIED_CONTAM: pimeloyl-ACP methyl ester carboxylesterase [Acetivibrio alkalicellulosi]